MTKAVTFKVIFGQQRDARSGRRAAPGPGSPMIPATAEAAAGAPVSRIARQLALAYAVRELLKRGALTDQREAAIRLGIVFPQMTHILNLLYLAPAIQKQILSGELVLGESALRPVCRNHSWVVQIAALKGRRSI